MKVARAFGKKRALKMGSQHSQWSSQGATTIALLKERGAACERQAEALATKRLELADERVTTVSSLLALGVEQLKRQLDAFKLLDGRKGAVKPQKGAMLRLLKDWIVDKYGAGAMDCTVDELDKAAEAKAARRPATGEPAKKRSRKAPALREAEGVVEAILDARAGSKVREYLVAWEPTPLPDGGAQVWSHSWHPYACFVVGGRQPCDELAELLREMDAVTPADCAARREHDEATERLASGSPSVGARVLVEPAVESSETWASGTVRALLDGGRATVELDAAGKRKRAQEVEVESDRLWAACAAAPAEVQPGFPVRVQFDDQWCFGAVARVLGASRHVLDITFDNGDKAVVPVFDVFHLDRCEPIVRL